LPITKLKWDARTVADIPDNTHIGFSHFSLKRRTPEIKTRHIYKAKTLAHIFIKVFGYSGRHGDGKVVITGKSSYLILPNIGFTLSTPIKGRIDTLTVYIYKADTCTNISSYNTCMSIYP
jgi:hypothetical protein